MEKLQQAKVDFGGSAKDAARKEFEEEKRAKAEADLRAAQEAAAKKKTADLDKGAAPPPPPDEGDKALDKVRRRRLCRKPEGVPLFQIIYFKPTIKGSREFQSAPPSPLRCCPPSPFAGPDAEARAGRGQP